MQSVGDKRSGQFWLGSKAVSVIDIGTKMAWRVIKHYVFGSWWLHGYGWQYGAGWGIRFKPGSN